MRAKTASVRQVLFSLGVIPLDRHCAECWNEIAPESPRVYSKVLDCSWHVMCAPPLTEEETNEGRLRREPRRMVDPGNKRGRPRKDSDDYDLLVDRGVYR